MFKTVFPFVDIEDISFSYKQLLESYMSSETAANYTLLYNTNVVTDDRPFFYRHQSEMVNRDCPQHNLSEHCHFL